MISYPNARAEILIEFFPPPPGRIIILPYALQIISCSAVASVGNGLAFLMLFLPAVMASVSNFLISLFLMLCCSIL